MRKIPTIVLAAAALLALPGALFAATPATTQPAGTTVLLQYFEDVSGDFQVFDDKGKPVDAPELGMTVKVGWTVSTGKGDSAELEIMPTKTIIKLSSGTNFKVSSLRTDLKKGADVFEMATGKIRTVAGASAGKDQYQVKTQSAVCGVRGTDAVFGILDDGSVDVTTITGTAFIQIGDLVTDVLAGKSFNSVTQQLMDVTQDALEALKASLPFTKVSVDAAEQAHQAWLDAGGEQGDGQGDQGGDQPPKKEELPQWAQDILNKVKEILGMEIGSVTIGGQTWSTVVVQPTFALGDLKASLYLPIIYSHDMFDPDDWYKPEGNSEWSFGQDTRYSQGVDPNYPRGMISDITNDLFLKIRYLEWGDQRDAFFFKVGNLNDITIGHGLIMRNFANDADFPSVRRVGLNLGMDFDTIGFEAMVNDVKLWPDIVGGRVYFRPIKGFKAAIGVSAVVDLAPAKDFPSVADPAVADAARAGDPIFINPGLDLDLPFVESDIVSVVAFADAAVMLPYFRSAPTDPAWAGVAQGFAFGAVIDPAAAIPVKNWGVAAGIFGNLILKDLTYRLEFRDYTGAFIPQFYSSGYERQRTALTKTVLDYVSNPGAAAYNESSTLGVYGEGGITLPKLFSLDLSYFWPWSQGPSGGFDFGNDRFAATFTLEKGVIPVINIWGTVSYERTNFVPTIIQKGAGTGLNLFDANTVVSATINYPVTENVDVTLLYTTTAKRDPVTGAVIYANSGDVLPELDTSLAIQTQVHL